MSKASEFASLKHATKYDFSSFSGANRAEVVEGGDLEIVQRSSLTGGFGTGEPPRRIRISISDMAKFIKWLRATYEG